jgi:hypothetical protein
MTVKEALNLARSLKYGPLPKPDDPLPNVDEAIELIHQERRECGFNWLTGEAAEQTLRESKNSHKKAQEAQEGEQ